MKHTMLRCLSLVMALATLVSVCALPAIVQAATPCNHYAYTTFGEDSADYVGVKESTCDEWGGKVYTCPKCKKDFVDSRDWANGQYKPLGHNYVEVEGSRENPTLDKPGKYTEQCTRCGKKRDQVVSALNCELNNKSHSFKDVTPVDQKPTCTEAGILVQECKNCPYTVTTNVPALGHTWDNGTIVDAPECGTHKEMVGGVEVDVPNYGTIKFVCTVEGCDGERVDDKVLPAQNNHKWKWHDAVAPTCATSGNTAGYECIYCNAKHAEEYKVLPALGHNITKLLNAEELKKAGLENVELGCEDEVIWGECSRCGNVDVSNAVADGKGVYTKDYLGKAGQSWTGNHYVKVEVVKDKNGATVYLKGDTAQKEVVDYNRTTMVMQVVASCQSAAFLACKKDGCEFGAAFGTKTPHNWTHDVPATCEQYGYKVCGGCGATAGYADEDGTPVPGMEKYNIQEHKYSGYVNGVLVDYSATVKVVGPGCTTYGYTEFRCIWCCDKADDRVQVKNEAATPLGHLEQKTEYLAPTCLEPGHTAGWICLRGADCTEPSLSKPSQEIRATGHGFSTAGTVTWVYHKETGKDANNDGFDDGLLEPNCKYGYHDGYTCGNKNRDGSVCGVEKVDYEPKVLKGKPNPDVHEFDGREQLITEPTCSTPGYVRNYCLYCYDAEIINKVTPIGHSFEEVVDLGDGKYEIRIKENSHIGVVPATCSSDGYYVYFCTNEDCDMVYGTGLTYENGSTVTATVAIDAKVPYGIVISKDPVAGTKTVAYKFVHEGTIKWNFKDPLNDQYDLHYDHDGYAPYVVDVTTLNSDEVDFDLDWTGVPHDADGKTGAEVGGVIAVDPKTGKLTGSCGISSWYEYDCDTCKIRYQELREDDYGPTGSCVEVPLADKPATCTQPGYKGKTACARCGVEINEGEVVKAKHTFDKTATAPIPYTGKTAPTCLEIGWDEHGYCTVCKAEAWEGIAPRTGHLAVAGELVAQQFRNCVVDGWDAHYECINGDCKAVVNNAKLVDKNGKALEGDALAAALKDQKNWVDGGISAIVDGANINGFKAKLGHNMAKAGTDLFGCMDDGYDWYECTNAGCDHVYVQANYHFGFVNHRYTDTRDYHVKADGKTLVECLESHLFCDNDVQTINKNNAIVIVDCDNDYFVNEGKVLPHTNKVPEVIKGFNNCAEWDAKQDHVCTYCKTDFNFKKVHELSGNYKANHHDADCKNWAHDVYTCTVCDYEWIENVVEKYGDHVWVDVKTVAPTYAAPGYTDQKCSVCGETRQLPKKALEGVKVDISADNKFEAWEIFDGSIVAVKVSTSAYNVGATSIKVTMSYNKDVFTYVGFSADNKFGKASFDGLANTTYVPNATNAAYGEDGIVTMVSVAEKTAAGQLQNVNLVGKETYMTLYFRVAINATSAAAPFGFEIVESTATEENTQVLGVTTDATTGKLVTTPVKTVVGDAVELAAFVKMIGDINGDMIIGMEDVEAMRKLILKAEGFVAPVAGAADIDKDGDVDIDDYALLQKYILAMIAYEDLAKALVGTAL